MVDRPDNTYEAHQERDAGRRRWLPSIGMLMPKRQLKEMKRDGSFETFGMSTLRRDLQSAGDKVSDRFKYLDQHRMIKGATFFVVDRDLVMGAGHAMWKSSKPTLQDLEKWRVVFDWWATEQPDKTWRSPTKIAGSNVYEIIGINILTLPSSDGLAKKYGGADFTIIQLSRPVEAGRPSFKFAAERPAPRSECWAAGYPQALPLKISTGEIKEVPKVPKKGSDPLGYRNTLVLRQGNSGSPILNKDNQVIAICIKGDDDFELHKYFEEITPINRSSGIKLDTVMRTDSIRLLLARPTDVRIDVHFVGLQRGRQVPTIITYHQGGSTYATLSEAHVDTPGIVSFQGHLEENRPLDVNKIRIRVLKRQLQGTENAYLLQVSRIRVVFTEPEDPGPTNPDQRFERWYNYDGTSPPVQIDIMSGASRDFILSDQKFSACVLNHPFWTSETLPAGIHGRNHGLVPPLKWPRP